MNKKDFYILNNVTYLDAAQNPLKPKLLINAFINYQKRFYEFDNLENKNKLKVQISNLVNCKTQEIILSNSASDSLVQISKMISYVLNENDEILIHNLNHSSHVLPWLYIAKKTKAKIKWTNNFQKDINTKTKIVAFTQKFNTLSQEDYDLSSFVNYAKSLNPNIIIINDATQAITNEEVNFKYFDCLVFSAYKLFGPKNLGFLIIKEKILKKLVPLNINSKNIIWNSNNKFNIKKEIDSFDNKHIDLANIYAFSKWLEYFIKNKNKYFKKLNRLNKYAFQELKKISNILLYKTTNKNIIIFKIKNFHSEDIDYYLKKHKIFVRSGKHCVLNSQKYNLDLNSTIRISFGPYNAKKDIDKLVNLLKNSNQFFKFY